jgi:ribosome-associated translation inhibitor RaiA
MTASPSLILTTEGFSARAELSAHAETKSAKLLRHTDPRVHLVRINVKRHAPHSAAVYFAVRATAENDGADHVAHADGAAPEAAINSAVGKLERALSETAAARKNRSPLRSVTELG